MERTTQDGLYRDKVPRVRGTLLVWDDIVVAQSAGLRTIGRVIRKRASAFLRSCTRRARPGSRPPLQSPRPQRGDQGPGVPCVRHPERSQRPILQCVRGLSHGGTAAVQQHQPRPGPGRSPLWPGLSEPGHAPLLLRVTVAQCPPSRLTPWAASPRRRCGTSAYLWGRL